MCVCVSGSSLTVSPGIDVAASGAAIVRPKSIKSPRLITKGKEKKKKGGEGSGDRAGEANTEQEVQIQRWNSENPGNLQRKVNVTVVAQSE